MQERGRGLAHSIWYRAQGPLERSLFCGSLPPPPTQDEPQSSACLPQTQVPCGLAWGQAQPDPKQPQRPTTLRGWNGLLA